MRVRHDLAQSSEEVTVRRRGVEHKQGVDRRNSLLRRPQVGARSISPIEWSGQLGSALGSVADGSSLSRSRRSFKLARTSSKVMMLTARELPRSSSRGLVLSG